LKYTFKELVDIPKLQELTDKLYAATSIPSAIIAMDGEILTGSGWQRICTDFHRKHPEIEKDCIASDTEISRKMEEGQSFAMYKCPRGLVDASSPVIIEGAHVANVFAGQLFNKPPDQAQEQFFKEQARKFGFDEKEYMEAFREIPVFPEDKFRFALAFLSQLAELIAGMGYMRLRELEAAHELRASEEKHRSYVNNAPDGIFISDAQANYLEVNPAACRMTGYTEQELLSMTIADLMPPGASMDEFNNLKTTGKSSIELSLKRKDGSIFFASIDAVALPDGRFMAFCSDITEHKQADEALQRQKALTDMVLETMSVGLGYAINRKIVWANKAVENLFGLSKDQYQGQDTRILFASDEEYERVGKATYKEIQERRTGQIDAVFQRNDGSLFHGHLKFNLVDPRDHAKGIIISIIDITERKQAEDALRKSEELYRTTIDSFGDAIHLVDRDLRFVLFNKRFSQWCEQLGFAQDTIGKPLQEVFPFLSDEVIGQYHRVFETGHPITTQDETELGGQSFITEVQKIPVMMGDNILSVVTIVTDITEQKKAEEALRESEEKLRGFMESATDAFSLWDSDLNLVECNQAGMKLVPSEIKKEDMIGKNILDFSPELKKKGLYDKYREVLETGKSFRVDDLIPHPRYGVMHFAVKAFKVGDHLGMITTDITERKQAEESLRESEERYRLQFENAPLASQSLDENGLLLNVNAAWLRALGYTKAEVLGKWFGNFLPDDYKDIFRQRFPQFKKIGEIFGAEFEMIAKDGSFRIVSFDGRTGTWPDGKFRQTYCVFKDITDLRSMEDSLRENEEKYRALFNGDSNAIFIYEPDTTIIIDANSATSEMYGYSKGELLGMSCLKLSEEAEKSTSTIEKIQKDQTVHVPIRYHRKKDGTVFPVDLKGYAITIAGKELMFAVIQDITERKRAQEALRESEIKFREMTEQVSDVLFQTDDIGTINYISPSSKKVFEVEPDEMIGHVFIEFLLESEVERAMLKFSESLSTGQPTLNLELRMKRSNGEFFWGELNSSILRRNEKITGTLGLIRDITERRRAEAQFHELFETMPSGVAIYEAVEDGNDFVFKRFNSAGEKIEGIGRESVIGHKVTEVFPGVEELGLLDVFKRVWETGRPEYHPISMYQDNRIVGWRENRIFKLPSGEIVTVYEDVTAQKEAQKEKEKLETQLRQSQKMESLGTLAGGIAHDFNNILSPILGYSEMALLFLSKEDKVHGYCEQILNASNRATDLVQQILIFSRQTEQEKKIIELHPIVEEALKLLHASIPSTSAVSSDIKRDCGTVLGDTAQIHQVVMNLCTNAYHALPQIGGMIRVGLEVVALSEELDCVGARLPPGEYACLCVRDNGHGIDMATMERMFEPFFTTKDVGKGTGLGLSTIHGIVTEHRGGIRVDSEVGKGTTFTIYLPRAADQSVAKESDSRLPASGRDARVLVVDDEPAITEMVAEMLRIQHYQVAVETSSLSALERFRKAPQDFDVVLTDQMMPGITGDKMAREMLAIRPDLPVVLMTGYAERVDDENGKGDHPWQCIRKPVVMHAVANAIEKALGRNK
jgi:PAS domain S-box-containing protein